MKLYKVCAKCNTPKPQTLEFFAKKKKNSDGLQEACKSCNSAYYYENRERIFARIAREKIEKPNAASERSKRHKAKKKMMQLQAAK